MYHTCTWKRYFGVTIIAVIINLKTIAEQIMWYSVEKGSAAWSISYWWASLLWYCIVDLLAVRWRKPYRQALMDELCVPIFVPIAIHLIQTWYLFISQYQMFMVTLPLPPHIDIKDCYLNFSATKDTILYISAAAGQIITSMLLGYCPSAPPPLPLYVPNIYL